MDFAVSSPDDSARGLTAGAVSASRYEGASLDKREVTGLMHAMMPRGVRVLDVGCGGGMVTQMANLDKGNEVVAIEPDGERAALARARGINVHNSVLDDGLRETLGLFDVVMSSDVLEHIAVPSDFLASLKAMLKPDGLLLLSVPNVAHWSVRWMLLRGRFDYEPSGIMDATHLRWFTADSFRRLLDATGFAWVELRHSAGLLLPVSLSGPLK